MLASFSGCQYASAFKLCRRIGGVPLEYAPVAVSKREEVAVILTRQEQWSFADKRQSLSLRPLGAQLSLKRLASLSIAASLHVLKAATTPSRDWPPIALGCATYCAGLAE